MLPHFLSDLQRMPNPWSIVMLVSLSFFYIRFIIIEKATSSSYITQGMPFVCEK